MEQWNISAAGCMLSGRETWQRLRGSRDSLISWHVKFIFRCHHIWNSSKRERETLARIPQYGTFLLTKNQLRITPAWNHHKVSYHGAELVYCSFVPFRLYVVRRFFRLHCLLQFALNKSDYRVDCILILLIRTATGFSARTSPRASSRFLLPLANLVGWNNTGPGSGTPSQFEQSGEMSSINQHRYYRYPPHPMRNCVRL